VSGAELETALFALFDNKAELMPLWLRLRRDVESLGPDVRLRVRDGYAEFDRVGEEFAIAEPTSHHRMEVGVHTPGLPFDHGFRPADAFGSRRITHRISVPEDSEIGDMLHTRLEAAYLLALDGEPR
jgi:hypothetical protein